MAGKRTYWLEVRWGDETLDQRFVDGPVRVGPEPGVDVLVPAARLDRVKVLAPETGNTWHHEQLGDLTVTLREEVGPGPVPRLGPPDRGLLASLTLTAALVSLFGLCAALTPPHPASLSVDRLTSPRTWSPIETAPPASPVVRHTARWSDGVDSVADEAGWPMKGAAGEAGAPDTVPTDRGRIEVRGQEADLIPRAPDPVVAPAQVGILGVLSRLLPRQSPVPAVYGTARAAGSSERDAYGDALAALPGFGRGAGGFDMIGTGRGGCRAGDSTCAAGTVGRGGLSFSAGGFGATCGIATCTATTMLGAYGGGLAVEHEQLGLRRGGVRAVAVPTSRAVARGSAQGLTSRQIARVVARHRGELRFCLDQPAATEAGGAANVRVVVQASGAVQSSVVIEHSLASPSNARCVADAVRRWSFPRAAVPTIVDLPLRVVSAG